MTGFRGNSFERDDIDRPIVGHDGNVCFPTSWPYEARRQWRILMEMPGAELPPPPTTRAEVE
jgi:hypothetical protein